jgi:hypothetical protein
MVSGYWENQYLPTRDVRTLPDTLSNVTASSDQPRVQACAETGNPERCIKIT